MQRYGSKLGFAPSGGVAGEAGETVEQRARHFDEVAAVPGGPQSRLGPQALADGD